MMECFIQELTDDYIWAYINSEPVDMNGVLYHIVEVSRSEGIAVFEKLSIVNEVKSDSQGD